MDVKEYLRGVRKLSRDIDAMFRARDELRYGLIGSGIPIKQISVQESAPTDRMAGATAAVVDLEKQIQKHIAELARERSKALDMLQALPKPEHRAIMVDYYINCYTWERVADLNGYSIQHVYELHGAALRELRKSE